MAAAAETWYVRLPNGRAVRARGTEVLRDHIRAGRIPSDSQVRRSGERAWLPLHQVADFADALGLAPPLAALPSAASPRPSMASEPESIGARTLLEELLNALDSSRQPAKLQVAAGAGVALAIGVLALELSAAFPPGPAVVAS